MLRTWKRVKEIKVTEKSPTPIWRRWKQTGARRSPSLKSSEKPSLNGRSAVTTTFSVGTSSDEHSVMETLPLCGSPSWKIRAVSLRWRWSTSLNWRGRSIWWRTRLRSWRTVITKTSSNSTRSTKLPRKSTSLWSLLRLELSHFLCNLHVFH